VDEVAVLGKPVLVVRDIHDFQYLMGCSTNVDVLTALQTGGTWAAFEMGGTR
jgi:hypothetical protein